MGKWRWGKAVAVAVILTTVTQLGGIAWLVTMRARRRLLAFVGAYGVLWAIALVAAPAFGRVALPCFGDTLRMHSVVYCGLMRNYVTPDLAQVAQDAADKVAAQYPGTITLALDGGFPFFDGMPLLPHLSHDDGQKLDLAFYYANDGRYLVGKTRSAIGYWAFETPLDETCPPQWATLRWGLAWLQPLWPRLDVDLARTQSLLRAVLQDHRVTKVFIEPSLAKEWDLTDAKLRFQGCRAARHDDHIHLQL